MASGRMFTKGCVFGLAVWLALMGAYAYVAWQRVPDSATAAIVGILGGTFAAMLLSSFIGLFTGNRDRDALRRAASMEPMKDGRLEAASGPIQALGKPLEAPFSGRPCLIYDYDIKRPGHGASDYAGYAMTPCAVQTLRGPVRVLGFVLLDRFPPSNDEQIDRGRGELYLKSATLEKMGVTSILSVLTDLVADDDGTIRKDYRIDGDGSLQGRHIKERIVPAGMPVTLLGHWSEARGGFVAKGPAVNRLFNVDLERTRLEVGGNAVKTFAIALVMFLILHGILGMAYILAPQSRFGREAIGSVWDERDCAVQKTKLSRGANPNETGSDALTPLMNAARMDDPACVSNLIAAGARMEDRDRWGDTALVHAVTANRDDNAKVLLAAGAKEFRVTAENGRAVSETDAPAEVVKGYVDAVHRADFEAMARLKAHVSVRRLEDQKENLSFWQSQLPKAFTIENGWMTADAATITIRGATPSGQMRVVFQLERHPDMSRGSPAQAEADPSRQTGPAASMEWQIYREWRPDER